MIICEKRNVHKRRDGTIKNEKAEYKLQWLIYIYNADILVNSIVLGFGFFGQACLSTNRGFRSLLPLDLPALTSYFIKK